MSPTVASLTAACALLVLAGCSAIVDRPRSDPRTDRPAPRIFGDSVRALPGREIAGANEIEGIWHFATIEQRARMEHGLEPFLNYSLHLKLNADRTYELVYPYARTGRYHS